MLNKNTPFRQLDDSFFKELKSGKLSFILQFERKHRRSFMIEIRNNFIDLYFLGHSIEVKRRKNKYFLVASNTFNPKRLLPDNLKEIVKNYDIKNLASSKKWCISFDDIYNYNSFEKIMLSIILKIVEHRKGAISEGVSEINHFIDNRAIGKNGILVIDRQVVYPGSSGERMDLLGITRTNGNNFTFVIIELKNKNNIDIGQVFSQTKRYMDVLYDHYEHFKATYQKILEQKVKLGLLKPISYKMIPLNELSRADIKGVVVMDNYNIKGDIQNVKGGGLLTRAINDWKKVNDEYDIKLFLKSNVLDDTFFMDLKETTTLLANYQKNNEFIQ